MCKIATIGNATIVNNQAEFHGGAHYLSNGSNIEVSNSIIYSNVPDQYYISDVNDSLAVSYSNIDQGIYGIGYSHETSNISTSLVSWDSSNINVNPLFNNINIRHKDGDGKSYSTMKVPLAYGPMQKFLARIQQQPNLERETAITVPRISFEMTGLQYDATRKASELSIEILKKVKKIRGTNVHNK